MTRDATGATMVLASGSPRRRDLLALLDLPFRIEVSDVSETLSASLSPRESVIALAERKAAAVAATLTDSIVLAADTEVFLDGERFGKPGDARAAERMLERLSGRTHEVWTGVVAIDVGNGAQVRVAVRSLVKFRSLTPGEIGEYVGTEEPLDRAGAYAIQRTGASVVERFDGCFTSIVGLPLCATAAVLASLDLPVPAPMAVCRLPDGAPCPEAERFSLAASSEVRQESSPASEAGTGRRLEVVDDGQVVSSD